MPAMKMDTLKPIIDSGNRNDPVTIKMQRVYPWYSPTPPSIVYPL